MTLGVGWRILGFRMAEPNERPLTLAYKCTLVAATLQLSPAYMLNYSHFIRGVRTMKHSMAEMEKAEIFERTLPEVGRYVGRYIL